jgi:hypothetical protein
VDDIRIPLPSHYGVYAMTIRARVNRQWVESSNGPTCDAGLYQLLSDSGQLLGEYGSYCAAADQHNAILDIRRVMPVGPFDGSDRSAG